MEHVYCEHCCVVEVNVGDKYCEGCTQEITDYLAAAYDERAQEFDEQIAIDGGLY